MYYYGVLCSFFFGSEMGIIKASGLVAAFLQSTIFYRGGSYDGEAEEALLDERKEIPWSLDVGK